MKICCVTTCRRLWGPTQSAHMCHVRPRTSCLSPLRVTHLKWRSVPSADGQDGIIDRLGKGRILSRPGRDNVTASEKRDQSSARLIYCWRQLESVFFCLLVSVLCACVRACRKSKSTPWLFYVCFANRDCYEDGSNVECPFNYPLVKWKIFPEGRNKQPDLITSKHCQRSFHLWNWQT